MKIVFQFVTGARAGQLVEVAAKPTIRLGRRPDNDVVFDAHRDLDVSGHHAEIRSESDGYYLYDVGSANGTFIDGSRVTRKRLTNGQEVVVGANGPRLVISFPGGMQPGAGPPVASPVPAPGPADPPQPRAVPPRDPGASPTPERPVAPDQQSTPHSPGQAAVATMEAGHKVGARTVAMMIDAALGQAKEKRGSSLGKSTVFFRSMVNQAVTKSTRRFKLIVVLLFVALAGSVGGFLVLRYFERREAREDKDDLRRQMASLMRKQGGAKTSQEKQDLAQRLEKLNRKLAAATPATAGKEIVRQNLKAVFLLAYQSPTGTTKGFCSAFAVRRNVLATNAHCVIAMDRFKLMGGRAFVVMNRSASSKYEIVRAVRHPAYHKPVRTISQDVGLIKVDRDLPMQVKMADASALKEVDSGDVMYTYGFPGRLAKVSSPTATLVQGVIGRVTKLNGEYGQFGDNKLIQHSAFTSGGTSGSPIFNVAGQVIAVNAGGYVEPGTLQVMDPLTGRASKLRIAKQLAGYNFGIRVDVLRELMNRVDL